MEVSVARVPAETGITFLRARLPAIARSGMIMKKPAHQHRDPEGRVVVGSVAGEPGEGGAVVADRRA